MKNASQEYTITLRYDGLDNHDHLMDLGGLADSIKGMDRILSVVAEFTETLEYNDNRATHSVNVYAKETRANCFSLDTVVQFSQQQQIFAGLGVAVVTLIVQYVFARNSNRKEEVKELSKNLETAINKLAERPENQANEQLITRMLDTIDRMAGSLRPSVRAAYQPIGVDCETLTITDKKTQSTYNKIDKDNLANAETVISEMQIFEAYITELDINSGACKVNLIGDNVEKRIKGKITDPAITKPNSAYAEALSNQSIIRLVAKAEIADGDVKKLHISDVKQ